MLLVLVVIVAFLLGGVCGLRSMTGPALVCWAAYFGWLGLDGTKLAFLHSKSALIATSALAIGELVADKFPFIPNRTDAGPLVVRFLSGGLCGAAFALKTGVPCWLCVLAGGFGAVAGAFAGFYFRRWLTVTRGLPDLAIALAEDVVAVGGGLLLVSGILLLGMA